MKETTVEQVNLSTTDGDMGVLAGHVPSILQLKPGVVEIFQSGADKQKLAYFGTTRASASAVGPSSL
jgi:F-type H+-transporting ATPase subunit delta